VNGIHEVRGSIPLASIAADLSSAAVAAPKLAWFGAGADAVAVPIHGVRSFAGIAQLVEHNLAKVGVAGSSPVSRSRVWKWVVANGHVSSEGG
jgi:hypothetical protein